MPETPETAIFGPFFFKFVKWQDDKKVKQIPGKITRWEISAQETLSFHEFFETFFFSRDYVLPDFTTIRRGFLKPADQTGKKAKDDVVEQVIRLNNERFAVPELLFSPSDVGISQTGIPEAIVECISRCEPQVQPWLYRNIVLTGGNACLRNMRARVEKDVRALAADIYDVRFFSNDP